MKTDTRHLAAAMYRLADEIRAQEGCVTASAETVESVALRLDEQTLTIMVLRKALKAARERITTDRECLFDCHKSWETGNVEDEPGQRGIAEYDEVLAKIDAVLQNSTEGEMMQQITIPTLADGETYIGAIGDAHGNLNHVILLPGDADPAPWGKQMEWAKSLGGDLPNRIEQAMLWDHHRDQFKKDWYWSNETHHTESGWAWFQSFIDGTQSFLLEAYELRARAVRRLPI